MKKIIFSFICLLLTSAVLAQTNFRELSFDQAVAAAKAEGKLVFIDVMTSWCGPCKLMAREVFPQKMVGDYMNKTFVNIKIDAEKGEGIQIAKAYNVHSYPTFLMLDTDKREVARLVGYKEGESFITELQRLLNPDATPEKLKARYESGERNAWLVKNYASYLHDEALNDRRNYEKKSNEINQMVADYYMGLSDADKFNPENFFVFRKYVTSADEPAVRFVVNNIKKVPAASRQELLELISKIYDNQEYFLISGGRPLSQEGINTFKSDLKALGINANHKYDNGITLMEARLAGDDAFIQACRTLFNKVNEMQLSGILGGLNTKFSKSDEATRKKASRVIREQLADMDVNMLYTAVMTVMDLEGSH